MTYMGYARNSAYSLNTQLGIPSGPPAFTGLRRRVLYRRPPLLQLEILEVGPFLTDVLGYLQLAGIPQEAPVGRG